MGITLTAMVITPILTHTLIRTGRIRHMTLTGERDITDMGMAMATAGAGGS